jgi:hypothetical protein
MPYGPVCLIMTERYLRERWTICKRKLTTFPGSVVPLEAQSQPETAGF